MSSRTVLTPAIVVGAIRYGESSRVVKLATRDVGLQSAIAKGALRPRSRFGASLQLLASGTAHLIAGRGELATLAAFDLENLHQGIARSVTAFNSAAVLAELAGRFLAPIPHPESFDALARGLNLLDGAPETVVELAALRSIWRMVDALGVSPSLSRCARDEVMVPPGAAALSLREGGVLCATCAVAGATTRLTGADRLALEFFLTGEGEAPDLDGRHLKAHRRLLARWIKTHLAEAELPALENWLEAR